MIVVRRELLKKLQMLERGAMALTLHFHHIPRDDAAAAAAAGGCGGRWVLCPQWGFPIGRNGGWR